MKNWLVTFSAKLDADERLEILRAAGVGHVDSSAITPLGDEVAVEVEASEEVAVKLRQNDKVRGVFPSSDMTYY